MEIRNGFSESHISKASEGKMEPTGGVIFASSRAPFEKLATRGVRRYCWYVNNILAGVV